MKKLFRKVLVFVILAFAFLTTNVFNTQAQSLLRPPLDESHLQSRNLYYKNYDTEIVIDEDGTHHVTIKIDVNYNVPMRGIFYNIPEEHKMDMEIDGKQVFGHFYFPVTNIEVNGDEYTIKREDGFQKIRIGNPDRYVKDVKSYTIKYSMTTQDKRLKAFDLIYFDILGGDVQVPIENFSFKVVYPKPVLQDPFIYSGAYMSRGNDYIDYQFKDTVVSGRNRIIIPSYTSVTIEQIVPADYFDYPTPPNYGVLGVFGMLGAGLVALLTFFKFGRDDVLTIVPNTRPMPGFSSAQIGYIYNNQANNRDIISLIIEWASKGYLIIHQSEDRKRAISLEKVRDISNSYPLYEQNLFRDLFETGDFVKISSLRNKFHRKINSAQTGLYNFFRKSEYRLKNSTSNFIKIIFTLIAPLMLSAYFILRAYQYFLHLQYAFSYMEIAVVIIFIFAIIFVLAYSIIQPLPKSVKTIVTIIFGFVGVVLYFVFGPVLNMIRALDIYTVIALVAFIGMLIAAAYMDKRTSFGNEIYGHVLGLRQFIEMAEKEELEMLVYDDPNYFYEVLPYAYVLGVSDVWSKQFEDIAVPEPQWYVGPSYRQFNTRDFMYELDSTMKTTTNTLSSIPVQTSGRGGGGWSSGGGGGGFSGGGGAGGGFGGGSSGGW